MLIQSDSTNGKILPNMDSQTCNKMPMPRISGEGGK